MATVNQLIETILDNIQGTKRGDLGLRARLLREAGYLPTGKRGGGRGQAHVNSDHCANLIIGLIASSSARGVVTLVEQFRELPIKETTVVNLMGLAVADDTTEPETLFLAIRGMIDKWRAGKSPWSPALYLTEIIGYCDQPKGPVILKFSDEERSEKDKEIGWWLVYGGLSDSPTRPLWAPMLSLNGRIIGDIVDLLGPLEDTTE